MDNEVKGEGNHYTTEFRQLDPRLGRWFSVDPRAAEQPWQSPYMSMGGDPISLTDILGDIEGDGDGDVSPSSVASLPDKGTGSQVVKNESDGLYYQWNGENWEEKQFKLGTIIDGAEGTKWKFTYMGFEEAKYASEMDVSPSVIDMIKHHEGLGGNVQKNKKGEIVRIYAYDDPSEIATIGYGHVTGSCKAGDCFSPENDKKDAPWADGITLKEADALLVKDVGKVYEARVAKQAKVLLTQNEFDVLVSTQFNGGAGSSLYAMINSQTYDSQEVYDVWLMRRISGGKEYNGLIKRRAMEAHQYLYGNLPDFTRQKITFEICSGEKVKTMTKYINVERVYINNWNEFADEYSPLSKKRKQAIKYVKTLYNSK